MKRPYQIILGVSILLTAFLWWIDDDPPYPNVWDTVREVFTIGVLFTLFFFGVLSGLYRLFARKKNNPTS